MAKSKTRRTRRGRRGTVSHRRPHMTGVGVIAAGIATIPVGVAAYEGWKSGGAQGAVGAVEKAYTGYDFGTKTWNAQNLVVGYLPLIAAVAFKKGMRKAGIRF